MSGLGSGNYVYGLVSIVLSSMYLEMLGIVGCGYIASQIYVKIYVS